MASEMDNPAFSTITKGTTMKPSDYEHLLSRVDHIETSTGSLKVDVMKFCDMFGKHVSDMQDFKQEVLKTLEKLKPMPTPKSQTSKVQSSLGSTKQPIDLVTRKKVDDDFDWPTDPYGELPFHKGSSDVYFMEKLDWTPMLESLVASKVPSSEGRSRKTPGGSFYDHEHGTTHLTPEPKGSNEYCLKRKKTTTRMVSRKLFDSDPGTGTDGNRHKRKAGRPKNKTKSPVEMFKSEATLLPKSIKVALEPTKAMGLDIFELTVASYIFSIDLPADEIVVDCGNAFGRRQLFGTLAPKQWVHGDVLTLAAARLTFAERRQEHVYAWYLPPHFSVLHNTLSIDQALKGYKELFMGDCLVSRIYIPLNIANDHWFLMIILVADSKILYVDSLPSSTCQDIRKKGVHVMAQYMEELLSDVAFYVGKPAAPMISKFPIVDPIGLGVQDNTYDCGIWVIEWMSLSSFWGLDGVEVRGNCNRMRLALDLVMSDYNILKDEVVKKAQTFYHDHHVAYLKLSELEDFPDN